MVVLSQGETGLQSKEGNLVVPHSSLKLVYLCLKMIILM